MTFLNFIESKEHIFVVKDLSEKIMIYTKREFIFFDNNIKQTIRRNRKRGYTSEYLDVLLNMERKDFNCVMVCFS